MRYLFAFSFILTLITSCIKDIKQNTPDNGCIFPAIAPLQPYWDPVWHPNGQLLGFNYTPLAGIGISGTAPCIFYTYFGKPDSTGFYLMNKDGTGFRRVTNFTLSAPAWSPDGNWVAFSLGPAIYKMQFNGTTFDTARLIQLTNTGANFYPSWTANSDTIYFDSNVDAPLGTSFYSIWKMAKDGTGKSRLTQSTGIGDSRQPYVASDNRVYYYSYAANQTEIFSMNKDGSNQIQVTFNGDINGTFTTKSSPSYYNGKIYYQQNGLWASSINGGPVRLESLCTTYDISTLGEIVYSKTDFSIFKYNRQIGTLWIMNADGTNNRQLTFNNF